MGSSDDLCRCGHPRTAHEHYRRGSDCSLCGAEVCDRFRKAPKGRGGDVAPSPAATSDPRPDAIVTPIGR